MTGSQAFINLLIADAFSALIEKFRENGLLTELENRYLRRNHNSCTESKNTQKYN